jgi:hypothetical protein
MGALEDLAELRAKYLPSQRQDREVLSELQRREEIRNAEEARKKAAFRSGLPMPEYTIPLLKMTGMIGDEYDESIADKSAMQHPRHQELIERAKTAYYDVASIRVKGGEMKTPHEYFSGLPNVGPEASDRAFQVLMKQDDGDALSKKVAKTVLNVLRLNSFQGETRGEYAATDSEIAARTRYGQGIDEAHTTSEGLAKDLENTRSYNILSVFQEGEHQPSWSTGTSKFLSAGGAALSLPLSPFFMTDRTAHGDTGYLALKRNYQAGYDPIGARIDEALYWDDQAEVGENENLYRAFRFGGYYPQFSSIDSSGMGFINERDTTTTLSTALSKGQHAAFSGEATPLLDSETFYRLRRAVPRFPDGTGATKEEMQEAAGNFNKTVDQWEQKYIDEHPTYKTPDTWVGPSGMVHRSKGSRKTFPTPAQNAVAMFPKYAFDIQDLPTLGMGAIASLAETSGRIIPRLLKAGVGAAKEYLYPPVDLAGELGYSASQGSQGIKDLFTPIRKSNVVDNDGNPAAPDDPRYPEYLENLRKNQQNTVDAAKNIFKNVRKEPKPDFPMGNPFRFRP